MIEDGKSGGEQRPSMIPAGQVPSGWAESNETAFDFRSDTITRASRRQLEAIFCGSAGDGWSASGGKSFEARVAELVCRPAAALMVSSTMGNQVSIRTHLNRPPNGIICDSRSHIMHQEAGSVGHLSGALPLAVTPCNGMYLTVEDIEAKAVLSDGSDACTCPTRLIHLENPLGGVVMPLEELQRIKSFAERNGLIVHMDGARLWEAVAAGWGSLAKFCNAADSVNLCLTKGLGGSVGSVIVGEKDFIHHAKWVKKSFGGGMRQPGLVAAAASAAIDEIFGRDSTGSQSVQLRHGHEMARRIASHWTKLGGKLVVPQQTNMVWLDLDAAGIDEGEWERQADLVGLQLHCSRIVTHHQISEAGILRLLHYMDQAMRGLSEREAIRTKVPRNQAVARLAASMREAAELASMRGYNLFQRDDLLSKGDASN